MGWGEWTDGFICRGRYSAAVCTHCLRPWLLPALPARLSTFSSLCFAREFSSSTHSL